MSGDAQCEGAAGDEQPAISATEFGLDGPRGPVFADVGFEAPRGSVVALEGPSGSGRTCLLLALTGRMKATAGTAVVEGRSLPRQLAAVRAVSALAAVPGVTDLDPALSAAEQMRERVLLQRRFGTPLRTLAGRRAARAAAVRERAGRALAAAGLDLEDLPKGPGTRVGDLERLESLRLSVALALVGEPSVLGVDDVDLKLTGDERREAWELLRSIAATGVTVLAVCSRAPADAVAVRTGADGTRRRQGPVERCAADGEKAAQTPEEGEGAA